MKRYGIGIGLGLGLFLCNAYAQSYDCMMHANQLIEVRSPVSGVLEAVPYKRGERVKKDAIVALLESSVERSAVAVAKHKAQQQGASEAAQARVELLGKKYERRRALALERAATAQERDDADLENRLAQVEFKQAREQKELAALEWQQSVDQLKRRSLRAPFDGLVVDQYIYPGELVDASSNKQAILKLAQVDPLRIEVILPVAMFGSIKPGAKAEIVPEKPLTGSYTTTVKLVDQMVDAASGTFGVRLELPNPQLKLPPGIKCRVTFKS